MSEICDKWVAREDAAAERVRLAEVAREVAEGARLAILAAERASRVARANKAAKSSKAVPATSVAPKSPVKFQIWEVRYDRPSLTTVVLRAEKVRLLILLDGAKERRVANNGKDINDGPSVGATEHALAEIRRSVMDAEYSDNVNQLKYRKTRYPGSFFRVLPDMRTYRFSVDVSSWSVDQVLASMDTYTRKRYLGRLQRAASERG